MIPATEGMLAQAERGLEVFVLAGVRFYQGALRPLNPWGCKFHPSCSHYALEAVEQHGLGRGLWLTLRRLLRCRPGVFGGYDPVPVRQVGDGQADGGSRPEPETQTTPGGALPPARAR